MFKEVPVGGCTVCPCKSTPAGQNLQGELCRVCPKTSWLTDPALTKRLLLFLDESLVFRRHDIVCGSSVKRLLWRHGTAQGLGNEFADFVCGEPQ